jgi:Na+/H+-dicarboxylate symporter
MKNFSLNTQILSGVLLGVIIGIILNVSGPDRAFYGPVIYGCELTGGVFISLLKMVLIPLIFTSITVGVTNLKTRARMDRVWKCTLIYFLSTTALATLLGISAVNIFRPGAGLEAALFEDATHSFDAQNMTLAHFIKAFLGDLFLNPVSAMADGKVLPTVIFSLFMGIAIVVAGEKKTTAVLKLLNELLEIILMMVGWIMRIAPVGIMALLVKLVATQDVSLLSALGKFMLVVLGTTLFHGGVVLPGILFAVTRCPPGKFFNGTRDALMTAFSTSSSSATLPVTMRCVEDNLKVDKSIAGFVLPLGATVNMDGTALYEAVAALFIANIMGIDLNVAQQLIVFFMAMIASIGAPGIPSAGMVTMIMVLQSVGLPAEAVAILLPIDRVLDTVRTAVNVEGDAVGSLIVQKLTAGK